MVRITVGLGGESKAAVAAINAVNKSLQQMQKQLGTLAKSADQNNKLMAKGFAGLAGVTQNLTAEIKTLGGVKEKELTFKKQTTDAKQFALEMINLRDAGSAFVIMSQQLGQVLDDIREDFIEWDKLVQQTAVLTTKAGEEIDLAIRQDIIKASNDMALEFALDTKQVVTGLREVVAMGFEFEEAALIMRAASLTAVGGLGEIADTSKFLVNVMRAFGLELENVNFIAATTTFIANETSLQITDMGIAMQFVATSAGTMGFQLAETAAALGVITDSGLRASIAGTSLNRFLTQLSRTATSSNISLESLGIEVTDQEGNFLSLADVLDNAIDALEGLGKAEQIEAARVLFGIRGMRVFNAIRAQGTDRMREMIDTMKQFETEEESIAFLTAITNGMLATQATEWVKVSTRVEQATRVMATSAIPVQTKFLAIQATLLEVLAKTPPVFRDTVSWMLVMGQAALGSSGQIFLMVTSIQTAGKSVLTLTRLLKGGQAATTALTVATHGHTTAMVTRSAAMDRSLFSLQIFNRRTKVATSRLKAMAFAAAAAGAAVGGLSLSMAAVNADTREQAIAATALASLMWALATAFTMAAITQASIHTFGTGAIIVGSLIAAAVAGAITFMASEQARASRTAQGLQEGAFFPGRPGRGTLFRAGEAVEGEFLAPEAMLRRLFREEVERIIIQQNVSRDQFNFEVMNFGEFDPINAQILAETIQDVQERRRFR